MLTINNLNVKYGDKVVLNIKKPIKINYGDRIGIIGCLFDNQQSTPVILNFDEDMWISIKKKYACIELESLDSKKESIMNKSYIDIATTTRICELVTKIKNGKIKKTKQSQPI